MLGWVSREVLERAEAEAAALKVEVRLLRETMELRAAALGRAEAKCEQLELQNRQLIQDYEARLGAIDEERARLLDALLAREADQPAGKPVEGIGAVKQEAKAAPAPVRMLDGLDVVTRATNFRNQRRG